MPEEIVKGVVTLDSSDKVAGIQDDKFFYSKDDLISIRLHKSMYISADKTAGAVHLLKEALANSIDECNSDNPHWKSHKKQISVLYKENERRIMVSDNGRGIPLDIMKDVLTKKHTSTKTIALSEVRNKKITGLNGVGLKIISALTDYMAMTSYRGNQCKTIEFFDGVMKENPPVKLASFQTGTDIVIVPSEKYLGPINLTTDIVEDYIRNMSYILDDDITISFTGQKNPNEKNPKKIKYYTTTFKSQGLSSAVKYMSSSLEFPPIDAKFISDDFDLSVSFSYDKTLDDSLTASFGNYVITTDGGTHELAATRAICEYFTREAKRQDPKAKYEITFDDCKRGLVMAVNLEHYKPVFIGQNKEKIANDDVLTDGKRGLVQALYNVMNNNPTVMKKVIAYLRTIAKAREESHKIRGVSTKKTSTFLEDSEIPKYITVSNRNSLGYKELFLAEGDSAFGSILNSRNPNYQAVYGVQGVLDNAFGFTLAQVIQKKTLMELIKILGTGIGKDFDISKLRYDKIIIASDADIDGANIASLIMCFFYCFMPEIIQAGKLYRALPPLYLMDEKSLRRFYSGHEWLYSKSEYYDMINTIIADNIEFAFETGTRKKTRQPEVMELSKSELKRWLKLNAEYKTELENLSKKTACDIRIVEKVCYFKMHSKNENEFQQMLKEEFPEMTYDTRTYSLIGSMNGEFFSLICDSLFDKSAKRFMEEMEKNEYFYVWYRNRKKSSDKLTRATIGEFMEEMDKAFNVKIEQRFKGLGEVEPELLFRTSTNPKLRKLLQISIKDAKKASETFELLHGKTADMREARRQLIESTKMLYSDIDN